MYLFLRREIRGFFKKARASRSGQHIPCIFDDGQEFFLTVMVTTYKNTNKK